jgi:hypothetical protein
VSGADPSAPRSSTADGTERVALDAFAAGAIPRRSRMQSGADASPRPADPLALQPAAGTPDAAAGTTGAQPGDSSEDRFGGVG